jgi:ABC-2 type transport system permease protein
MSYLLTTPNSRVKIAATQALSVLTNIFALILVNVLVVIIISEIAFKGHLMIGRFIGLNFVLFGVMACVSGLTFLISVLISDYGKAVGMSSGLMGFLFIMNMIKNLNEDLDFFKYTTFLSLVNIDKILESTSFTLVAGSASLISGLAIFAFSIYIFDRKSLTI